MAFHQYLSMTFFFYSATCQSTLAPVYSWLKHDSAHPSAVLTHPVSIYRASQLAKLIHNLLFIWRSDEQVIDVCVLCWNRLRWVDVYIKMLLFTGYTEWAYCFQIFHFSFQLGNSRHIRKLSFLHLSGVGRGHDGELCHTMSGVIATVVGLRKMCLNQSRVPLPCCRTGIAWVGF